MWVWLNSYLPNSTITVSLSAVAIIFRPPNITNSTQCGDIVYNDREWYHLPVTDRGSTSYIIRR